MSIAPRLIYIWDIANFEMWCLSSFLTLVSVTVMNYQCFGCTTLICMIFGRFYNLIFEYECMFILPDEFSRLFHSNIPSEEDIDNFDHLMLSLGLGCFGKSFLYRF